MERTDAWELLTQHITNKNLRKHMLATEACMRRLARLWQQSETEWGLAGLLHDLDYERTKDEFARHGFETVDMLAQTDIPEEVRGAIQSHAGHTARNGLMAKALYAVDPLTGLIVAAALMHPQKKLQAVTPDFVKNRFKEKHFARGAKRDQINACQECGITLEDFISECLQAMQEISTELGL